MRRVLQVGDNARSTLGRPLFLADHWSVRSSESSGGSGLEIVSRLVLAPAEAFLVLLVTIVLVLVSVIALPPGLLSAESAATAELSWASSTAAAAPATTILIAIALATASVSAAASIAAASTITTAVRIVTHGPSLVSPVATEPIFFEFGHLSAFLDVEVNAVHSLFEPLKVLEEGLEVFSTDVEHDSRATAKGPHVLDLITGPRVPVFLQNRIRVAVAKTASLHQ